MGLWQAVFLGVVQGLTEFLPISSSGHLVLFEQVLGVRTPGLTFEIALHFGTLLAVLGYYRADFAGMVAAALGPFTGRRGGLGGLWADPHGRLLVLLAVGTLPAAVIGLAFKPVFERLFDSLTAVGFFWLLTAGLLWLASSRMPVARPGAGAAGLATGRDAGLRPTGAARRLPDMSWRDALFVGFLQAAAILPGVSRSGSTIAGGLLAGFAPEAAARYSFFLSVPAVAGAILLDLKDVLSEGLQVEVTTLLVGMATAFLSGLFAIKALLRLLGQGRLNVFAWYTLILGLAVLVWQGLS